MSVIIVIGLEMCSKSQVSFIEVLGNMFENFFLYWRCLLLKQVMELYSFGPVCNVEIVD